MASRGISNRYLEKMGKKLFPPSFLGVYPADVYPRTKRKTYSFIFNTGLSSSKGEHFVAVYVSPKKVFYFDSFGMKPNKKPIKLFLAHLSRLLFYNKQPIQHDASNFCGFYCLAFLLHKYKGIPRKQFYNLFTRTDLQENDQKVVNFILEVI